MPSFIEQVHYYGQDSTGLRYSPLQAIFSFFMVNHDLYDGKFVFGGYDLKYAKEGSTDIDVFWMPMKPSFFYWTAGMSQMVNLVNTKVGKSKALKMKSAYAIFDTGMSLSFIPPDDFEKIRSYLIAEYSLALKLNEDFNIYMVDCAGNNCKNLPELRMQFKGYKDAVQMFTLPPDKYLIQNSPWNEQYLFALQPSPITEQVTGAADDKAAYWILGDCFLT